MGQEATEARRDWLQESDGRGFFEETPTIPVISVTITPAGRCYDLAKDIIRRLARVQGEEGQTEPHITLQGIYDYVPLAPLQLQVARLAAQTQPFAVDLTGLGLLASPNDPEELHLHLRVEKSDAIVALYSRLKAAFDSLGLRTYPYSAEEWVPHLTLASGRWSRGELAELLREVGPRLPVCRLPVADTHLNRRDKRHGWQEVERYALGKSSAAG